MLSPRKAAVLQLIVSEHVETAQPIGSEMLVRKHALGISPATVRNIMAELEEEGYITHPHTSAGRVPAAQGYRYYVECLMDQPLLPAVEQYRILHQFHQVERQWEEWARLAAALLAQSIDNVGVVTLPQAPACRLHRFDLMSIHDRRAWLVVLLHEGMLKQHLMHFDEPTTQEDLAAVVSHLNPLFHEQAAARIAGTNLALSPLEREVTTALVQLMQAVDRQKYQDLCLDGLRRLLNQPEFAEPERLRRVVEVLGERSRLLELLPPWSDTADVRISIGEENAQEALHDLSLVAARYGIPGEIGGVIAVLGPTRLRYKEAISTARYLAVVLSELLRELHGY